MPAENTADMGTRNVEDLTGRTFGLDGGRQEESRNGRSRWLCRCTCGGEKIVTAYDLKAGKVKSCGCLAHRWNKNAVDISGQRFGRLTALEPTENKGQARQCILALPL